MDVKTKTERQTKEMVKETVFKERAQKVLASMKENGMDQLIVSDPASINYLMGRLMNPGERLMVLVFDAAAGKTELVISKLYPQGDNPIWPVTYVDDVDDCVAILSEKIAETGVIGIDKNWAAKFLLRLMELRPNLTYKNGSYIIDKIRQIKTNEEQEFMIEASRLNDLAVERLIKEVNKGYTEKELADKLLDIYHDLGSEGFSFYPICCYGANAADPHHSNDDSTGKSGDSVILDIGCLWTGYCSDMTRTVFLGNVSEEQKKVYNIVKTANERAIAAVKPGVRFCDVDAAARDYITEQGYGPYFVHRTGHNIGQEVHEAGDVSSANTDILKPGMTFSIEPGIYLTGNFGVRVEDLVLVTEDGCKVLNHFTKDLIVVPEK